MPLPHLLASSIAHEWAAVVGSSPRHPRMTTPVDRIFEPAHGVSFEGWGYPFDVQFSPDGRLAYCMLDSELVDLWAAGLGHLAWGLGGVLAVVVLAYAFIVLRVLRRPQVAGAPHCRRCNYDVSVQAPLSVARRGKRGLPAKDVRCPECGAVLAASRPRRGRTRRRRLATPSVLVLASAALFGWFLISGVSPSARAGGPGVWSPLVDRIAEMLELDWLLDHRTAVSRLVVVDTKSARIRGERRIFRGALPRGMQLSPDGRHLVIENKDGALHWVRTANGRISRSIREGGPPSDGYACIVGFGSSDPDPWVYYGAIDQVRNSSLLVKWRPQSGEQQVLFEESVNIAAGAGGRETRYHILVPRRDGIATLSAPSKSRGGGQLIVRAPEADGCTVERTIAESFPRLSPLVPHPNGRAVFFTMGRHLVLGYDLETGATLQTLGMDLGRGELTLADLAISPDGEHLVVPTVGSAIMVWEFRTQRWVARLACPTPYNGPMMAMSTDGRWLAAMPLRTRTQAGPHKHTLFLFDLATIERGKAR